ncbi:hypothetical protein AVEN_98242-1 [Araneus ventricosus]|uniref:Uncharacterized protein n=1 Tax=Araneus ventricosus TaxID=182803 RepID=A0A4Y2KQW7_ARAVE|nr:hypothetical protein AVEN_98242-1 [Araneus ventricosus]
MSRSIDSRNFVPSPPCQASYSSINEERIEVPAETSSTSALQPRVSSKRWITCLICLNCTWAASISRLMKTLNVRHITRLRHQSKEFYAAGIRKLTRRWGKCINVNGYYVEKIRFSSKHLGFSFFYWLL